MAKPRVFISSTYYDLRAIRADLERYIREHGFEPVLNERGHVPFHAEKHLEDACYKEIELSDILVSIIGGRYGTESREEPYSISQKELKTALELGKPVYIFVEKNVLAEYRTYVKNKDVKGITFASVDDPRTYHFLEEVHALPLPQPMAAFETARDITDYLQGQWAGLFQRLLQESARYREVQYLQDIRSTLDTLNKLVSYLAEERKMGDTAIKDILLSSHPLLLRLRKLLNVQYRVYFVNRKEMNAWLAARSCEAVPPEEWDNPDYMEWIWKGVEPRKILKVKDDLFEEDGKLRVLTPDEWNDKFASLSDFPTKPEEVTSEEIPF